MPSPRALYVHIPFCRRKCHYCAFNSQASFKTADIEAYLRALLLELDSLEQGRPLVLQSIYIGGGTPTVLDPGQLDRLISALKARCSSGSPQEWTIEVNPGTLDPERLAVIAQGDITRVSMGVQTMDEVRLRSLGRIHGPQEVIMTVEALRKAGLLEINLDLIYGLPGETLSSWLQDVKTLLDLEPVHLSLYELQFEQGTVFFRDLGAGRLERSGEELVLAMRSEAERLLQAQGLVRYEVSNYAQAGHESLHNTVYWRNEPYHGIGAGAWARVQNRRTRNEKRVKAYTHLMFEKRCAVVEQDFLGPREDYLETLCAGLRTREGVDLDCLARRTGLDPTKLHGQVIQRLVELGKVIVVGRRLVLTEEGLCVLDTLLEQFLAGFQGPEHAQEIPATTREPAVS